MKLLLDNCVPKRLHQRLIKEGYDVIWIAEWDNDPGDSAILDYAYRSQRILITLDKDFGELVFLYSKPHCGIIRLMNYSVEEQTNICLQILRDYSIYLKKGAIITAVFNRIRVYSGLNEHN